LPFRFVLEAILKVQQADISKLKPYWRNPRKRTAESIRKIADSIKVYGWRQPIVVDRDFVIVIGHGRYEAATLLETKRVPIHIATDLTKEQVRALRLADNRVHEESYWDMSSLLAEIGELKELDFDLSMAGFEPEDLKRLAEDIGEIPDATQEKPFTGDLGQVDEDETAAEDPEPEERDAEQSPQEAVEPAASFSELITVKQRAVINAAIKRAMKKEKLTSRGDALFHVCELYLEANE
jgi:ParB-like chromosome segregation protein Spo0J